MKPRGPFKFIRNDDEGNCIYEGMFELADDGTPDSDQFLRIRVTESGGEFYIDMDAISKHSEARVASCEATSIDGVGRMLYGAARIVTTRTLQPL